MARRRKINPLEPLLEKLPAPLKNKYIITLVIFLFIFIFFNKTTPLEQWSLQKHKTGLEEKREYYDEKLQKVTKDRSNNERHVEKFARENYYMKKKDEDVFIIVDDSKSEE